jgi:hypothetical protein
MSLSGTIIILWILLVPSICVSQQSSFLFTVVRFYCSILGGTHVTFLIPSNRIPLRSAYTTCWYSHYNCFDPEGPSHCYPLPSLHRLAILTFANGKTNWYPSLPRCYALSTGKWSPMFINRQGETSQRIWVSSPRLWESRINLALYSWM